MTAEPNHFEIDPAAAADCLAVADELFAFIDRALAPIRHQSIQLHIEQCPPCADVIQFHIKLQVVVQKTCLVELPPGLRDRVFGSIIGTSDSERGR